MVDPTLTSNPHSPPPPPLPGYRDDPKVVNGKLAVFQYLAVAIFLFLISGFWDLQVKQEENYKELAEKNRTKALPIPAPRGKILDRDGRVIVDNHSSWSLILSRETLKPEHVQPIAVGLSLDPADLQARLDRYRGRPKYEPIIIKEELTPSDLAFVEAYRAPEFFPEMELIHAQKRLYPQNGMAAHVIGYTGEINEAELDLPEFVNRNPGSVIGKSGIERQYNDILTGVDGERQVIVDNRGRERDVLGIKEAKPGQNLQLTIDLDLQVAAEIALGDKQGGVVALDPRTGEVLAMVSRPSFDPNKFTFRISNNDWKELMDDAGKPLLNRAIQAQLAPGSTFKPITALAGLETGTVDDEWQAHCGGGASFYGHYHACWNKHGHGAISLHRAIRESCDVFFYTLGVKMGIDKLAFYGEMVGLGKKTGIDLPNEASGIMPSTAWKIRTTRQKWFAGETVSVAIGQGAVALSPLQLAEAIGGISVGGVWHRPHLLVPDTAKDVPRQWALSPDNVKAVIDGMWGVVNEPGGTGGSAALPGIEVCGKTGSAQVVSNEYLRSHSGAGFKDNSWFVGFAPRKAPEIVVAALFQSGEHGSFSAPVVKAVLKAYFDKKARLKQVAPPAQTLSLRQILLKPDNPSLAGFAGPMGAQ